ncbi:MAG TPA: hypothetical protein VFQ11_02670 [Nocardioidaceae bacterium]|jgi:hypothetical protein|nr:hypothetical protein [Nocardioidaceae bacterium]
MNIIVIGGSLAGANGVEEPRTHGCTGEITLIGAEAHPPDGLLLVVSSGCRVGGPHRRYMRGAGSLRAQPPSHRETLSAPPFERP